VAEQQRQLGHQVTRVVTLTYAHSDSPEWEALAMGQRFGLIITTPMAEMSANSPLEFHADQEQWGRSCLISL
jgi:hypothetical protein